MPSRNHQDNRMKDIIVIDRFDDMENNGLVRDSAYNLVPGIKAKNDPELKQLCGEFEKLFLWYE